MTREQHERFTNRKSFQTISIRNRTTAPNAETEVVRVTSLNQQGKLVIEIWTRKLSQLSAKAFKRQHVQTV